MIQHLDANNGTTHENAKGLINDDTETLTLTPRRDLTYIFWAFTTDDARVTDIHIRSSRNLSDLTPMIWLTTSVDAGDSGLTHNFYDNERDLVSDSLKIIRKIIEDGPAIVVGHNLTMPTTPGSKPHFAELPLLKHLGVIKHPSRYRTEPYYGPEGTQGVSRIHEVHPLAYLLDTGSLMVPATTAEGVKPRGRSIVALHNWLNADSEPRTHLSSEEHINTMYTLLTRTNFHALLLAPQALLGTSLETAMFRTPSYWLRQTISRIISSHVIVAHPPMPDSITPRGGYNQACAIHETRNPVLKVDFTSMYTSLMLALQMSTLTYAGTSDVVTPEEEALYTIILNDESSPIVHDRALKRYVKFRKTQGVDPILNLISEYQALRRQHAASPRPEDHILAQTLKLQVNTIYGLHGSKTSPIYNREVMAAITLAGRILAKLAIAVLIQYGKVISWDTDGGDLEVDPQRTPPESYSDLVKRVNDEIRSRLPPGWDPQYVNLKYEGVSDATIVSTKRSLRIMGDDVVVKGITTCDKSRYVVRRTREILGELLRCTPETRQSRLDDLWRQELSRVVTHPQDYTRHLSSGNALTKGIWNHIRASYPGSVDPEDGIFVLRVHNDKPVSDASLWGPISKVRSGELRVAPEATLAEIYYLNLKKFFPDLTYPGVEVAKIGKARLPKGQCHLRIERPCVNRPGVVVRDIITVPHSEVAATLEAYRADPHVSVHEYTGEIHKLFFDLDAEPGSSVDVEGLIRRVDSTIGKFPHLVLKCLPEDGSIAKISYHIIFMVAIDRRVNQDLAKILKVHHPYIDTGVYSTNHSMRLPGFNKWNGNTLENRRFAIPEGVPAESYSISNVYGLPMFKLTDFEDVPLRSRALPRIREGIQVPDGDVPWDLLATKIGPHSVTRSTDGSWFLKKTRVDVTCPHCLRQHKGFTRIKLSVRKGELMLFCFRNADNPHEIGTGLYVTGASKHVASKYDPSETWGNTATLLARKYPRLSQQFLRRYSLTEKTTIVNAPLGSGKTTQLVPNLADRWVDGINVGPRVILFISCRKTLSTQMVAWLNANIPGWAFLDYRHSTGPIDLKTIRKAVVQLESIVRLTPDSFQCIDILVLDEFESLINQMPKGCSHNAARIRHSFALLCHHAKKVVALDGCMEERSVNLIKYLTNVSSIQRIDHRAGMYPYSCVISPASFRSPQDVARVVNEIRSYVSRGLRVYCVISERRTLMFIKRILEGGLQLEGGIPTEHPCVKVEHFTGGDGDLEVEAGIFEDDPAEAAANPEGLCSMARKKEIAFRDLSAYIVKRQPQVLLTTTTMSAGINIDIEGGYFHHFVHWYSPCVDPLVFGQAIARCRKYLRGSGRLFIDAQHAPKGRDFHDVLVGERLIPSGLIDGPMLAKASVIQAFAISHAEMLAEDAVNVIMEQMTRVGYDLSIVTRAMLPPERCEAKMPKADRGAMMAAVTLMQEHLDQYSKLVNDPTNFKRWLREPGFDVVAEKCKILKCYGLKLDEANALRPKTLEVIRLPRIMYLYQGFIRSHDEMGDATPAQKWQLVDWLRGEPGAKVPVNIPALQIPDPVEAQQVERETITKMYVASRDGVLDPNNPNGPAATLTRLKVEFAQRVYGLLKDGPVVYNPGCPLSELVAEMRESAGFVRVVSGARQRVEADRPTIAQKILRPLMHPHGYDVRLTETREQVNGVRQRVYSFALAAMDEAET